jgi:glycosyltransferase involved in cell wall biosynthesis
VLTNEDVGVTILGFTVSDELIHEVLADDPGMPMQTHTFAWGVVNALTSAGCRVTLLSAMPVATYPRNPHVLFRGGRFNADGIEGILMGFVNLPGAKHLTRLLGASAAGVKATRRWKGEVLLIHGVHTPFLWAGLLLARLRGLTVVPILTDPPGVRGPDDGPFTRLLRKIDVGLARWALGRCDGVVALTRALAEDFARGRPSLIVEGILNPPKTPVAGGSSSADRDTFEVVYAGGLTRAYGVDRLVEAIKTMPDPNVRLRTFGRGELEGWIAEQSTRDLRICPPGFLAREQLARQLADANVLVNPRPVHEDFAKYSFPSKLIEYMWAGVPVVTTRLPGIPPDYEGRLVISDSDTVEGLRSAIVRVMTMPPEAAAALGAAGSAFVRATRNVEVRGTLIREFLLGLSVKARPQ